MKHWGSTQRTIVTVVTKVGQAVVTCRCGFLRLRYGTYNMWMCLRYGRPLVTVSLVVALWSWRTTTQPPKIPWSVSHAVDKDAKMWSVRIKILIFIQISPCPRVVVEVCVKQFLQRMRLSDRSSDMSTAFANFIFDVLTIAAVRYRLMNVTCLEPLGSII